MSNKSITIDDLCMDLRQISIRRGIAQRTRKALELVIRARIAHIFLDQKRQALLLKKLDRVSLEEKILEMMKDKKFKATIQALKEAIIKPLGYSDDRRGSAKRDAALVGFEKVWKKYPEQKSAIDMDTHGVQVGLKALIADEKMATKHLEEVAMKLPVWQKFAKDIPGLGIINFGKLIGEAGALSRFRSKECLYKYLGLGVFNGHAQGKIRGMMIKGDAAIPEGYNRGRLASTLLIGQGILKTSGMKDKKTKELTRAEDPYVKLLAIKWKDYEEKAKIENAQVKKANPKLKKVELKKLQISKKTVMLRSIRWITKMIVRDLRYAWIACEGKGEMPDPATSPMLTGVVIPYEKKPLKAMKGKA